MIAFLSRTLITQRGRLPRALGSFDLERLLLLGYVRWLWQVDVQYALIKLRLDLRRVGIERQRDRSAERAIAAFHHVPILILVLLVALGLFSPRTVSLPSTRVTST